MVYPNYPPQVLSFEHLWFLFLPYLLVYSDALTFVLEVSPPYGTLDYFLSLPPGSRTEVLSSSAIWLKCLVVICVGTYDVFIMSLRDGSICFVLGYLVKSPFCPPPPPSAEVKRAGHIDTQPSVLLIQVPASSPVWAIWYPRLQLHAHLHWIPDSEHVLCL